jgi:hypothetical protein
MIEIKMQSPSKVKEYCNKVGFNHIIKLPVDNPFNVLYEVKVM